MTPNLMLGLVVIVVVFFAAAGLTLWRRQRTRAVINLGVSLALAVFIAAVAGPYASAHLGVLAHMHGELESARHDRDAVMKQLATLRTLRAEAEAAHHSALNRIEREVTELRRLRTDHMDDTSLAARPIETAASARLDTIITQPRELQKSVARKITTN